MPGAQPNEARKHLGGALSRVSRLLICNAIADAVSEDEEGRSQEANSGYVLPPAPSPGKRRPVTAGSSDIQRPGSSADSQTKAPSKLEDAAPPQQPASDAEAPLRGASKAAARPAAAAKGQKAATPSAKQRPVDSKRKAATQVSKQAVVRAQPWVAGDSPHHR